jgi:hypothetical protein
MADALEVGDRRGKNMSASTDDPRRHVFRYDEHMPDTDDLSLIVLKGHLLVEEMLLELSRVLLPNSAFLDEANLRFHQLAHIVRAAEPTKSQDNCWKLIFALNSLRNELVHNLEPPKLETRLQVLFAIAGEVQAYGDIQIDKSRDNELQTDERLRQAVIDCMQFLRALIFEHENRHRNAP